VCMALGEIGNFKGFAAYSSQAYTAITCMVHMVLCWQLLRTCTCDCDQHNKHALLRLQRALA